MGSDTAEVLRVKAAWGRRIAALRATLWPNGRKPLADLMDITEHAVGRWERGEVFPSALELRRLAKVFHVDEAFLISGTTAGLSHRRLRELHDAGVFEDKELET